MVDSFVRSMWHFASPGQGTSTVLSELRALKLLVMAESVRCKLGLRQISNATYLQCTYITPKTSGRKNYRVFNVALTILSTYCTMIHI